MRTYQLFFATFLLFTALFTGCGPNNSAAGETGNSNPSGDSLGGVVRQTPSPQSLETTSTSDRTKV
ncbi:MAG: hypothetical protein J2P41_19915, partial [Blastocatellia bacterium]|nr:hypothetical protein [Blastocatellia bacterium]